MGSPTIGDLLPTMKSFGRWRLAIPLVKVQISGYSEVIIYLEGLAEMALNLP